MPENAPRYFVTGLLGATLLTLGVLAAATLAGWIPDNAVDTPARPRPPDTARGSPAAPDRAATWATTARKSIGKTARCASCGVIESVRERTPGESVAAGAEASERDRTAPARYETTVRFDDGATRVFASDRPTGWRAGDRIKVIGDAIVAHG